MKKYRVGFVSLGCSKNLCDTEVMLRHAHDAGYEITPDETEADVVIINTCAFIESAKKESIDNILDIAWLKEHGKLKAIIVTGCMAERYREQLLDEMPEIDAILGVGSIHHIADAIADVLDRNNGTKKYSCFDPIGTGGLGGERIITTGDYMAYMKIAEGCSNNCTFCAIPNIRGKLISRPLEELIEEAKDLDRMGIKELNLIAQDTTAYGTDLYGSPKLVELLRGITENTGIPWIRMLYCYPDKISDELVQEIASNDRVVKYMDIPIQHINENVLRRMNRHGKSKAIRESIKKLRENVPDIILRTTAIVGFPGETDDDFAELCRFVKDARIDRFGAFTYSREEGTPAYDFTDIVDEQTAQDRYDILMRTQLEISNELNRQRIGRVYTVLCEGYDEVSESYYGRSYGEAADIDGKIWFSSENRINEGAMVEVKITDSIDYDLLGQTVL